ncbi:MAG: aminotransferase class I/II-fold pyridoxal phosphate-dependent enzyme [Planctomycetota bacterium]|nr:MAG: aminotransferase class I/II-fold pyridoxal phosphate-dependent enzyme [Planctomycetota bacterium]
MDPARLLSARVRSIDVSGIRRVFELGASLKDPINLSIGQPDFPTPDPIKRAAERAIDADKNGYTLTTGVPELRSRIVTHLERDLGWTGFADGRSAAMVTSGTSGALLLAALALLDPGDECVIPDPYFVIYPNLPKMAGAGDAVLCDTYPDFRMTADRVEPLLTERTKFVLMVSPANPTGVTLTTDECRDLLELCRSRGVPLICDEIYDEFVFPDAAEPDPRDPARRVAPSPARLEGAEGHVIVIRGFGKTYGCTGWRLGYAAGPEPFIREMAKLQQYSFVCAPSMAQWGVIEAFDCDMSGTIARYARRRDMVVEALAPLTDLPKPGGSFFAFFEIPERLGMTGARFAEACVERNVLVIPGGAFSARDTHVRLSFAVPDDRLERGLGILADLLRG